MTNYEYMKTLNSAEEVGNFICQQIDVAWAEDRENNDECNCDLCPFNANCWRKHNGVTAWLNNEKARGGSIVWNVECYGDISRVQQMMSKQRQEFEEEKKRLERKYMDMLHVMSETRK